MNRKAGLEFSVNSIVSFIIAIIIFGFGIYLLFFVFSKANVVDVPDFCNNILNSDIQNNEVFSICPKTVDLSKKELLNGFKVSFVFVNLQDEDFDVNIFLDSNSDFEILSIPVFVSSGNYVSSSFLLRLKKDSAIKSDYAVKILLCKSSSDSSDNCNSPLESKILLVNIV